MTPLGWLGRKTSTQTKYHIDTNHGILPPTLKLNAEMPIYNA